MVPSNLLEGEQNAHRLAPFTPTSDDAQKVGFRLLQLTHDDIFFDIGCGDGRVVMAAATTTNEASASCGISDDQDEGSGRTSKRIRCVGVEMDPLLCRKAVQAIERLPTSIQSQIQIICGDALQPELKERGVLAFSGNAVAGAYNDDLTLRDDCTALYLYLLPQGLVQLKPLLDNIVHERRRMLAQLDSVTVPRRLSFRVVTYMFQIHGWVVTAVDRTSKAGAPVYLYEFDIRST